MKKRKIIIGAVLALITFLGIRSVLWAQKSHEKRIQHITEKMAKKLDLTTDQQAKVYTINLKRAEGHLAAYEAGRKKEIIVAAVKEWEKNLRTVLTPEQLKKLNIQS